MKFKDLLNILHVRAYVGKQDVFLIKLLKGSVSEPDKIDIVPSTLKGYFQGNRITELAATLKDAGFSPKKLTSYIEGLYELPHKDSKTYDRYGDKLYKDVLYENAKNKISDITMENMASLLAAEFKKILTENLSDDSKIETSLIDRSMHKNDLTSKSREKIISLCRSIAKELESLKYIAEGISNNNYLINTNSNDNNEMIVLSYKEENIKLGDEYKNTYNNLLKYACELNDKYSSKTFYNDNFYFLLKTVNKLIENNKIKNVLSEKYKIETFFTLYNEYVLHYYCLYEAWK